MKRLCLPVLIVLVALMICGCTAIKPESKPMPAPDFVPMAAPGAPAAPPGAAAAYRNAPQYSIHSRPGA
jgi:hypothetical protein